MANEKKNLDFQNMSENEEMTVTLTLDDGSDLECVVLTIFEAGDHDYIALLPLDGKEAEDGEGHLWGRLKSGAGWIDLTHVRDEEIAAWPVSAAFAEDCPPEGAYARFAAEESKDAVWIAWRGYEPLKDVCLLQVDMAAEAEVPPVEVLCYLPELPLDTPLVTGVVFPGDMSTYGLLFTDEEGEAHFFTVCISGRNGTLLMEKMPSVPELTPTPPTT